MSRPERFNSRALRERVHADPEFQRLRAELDTAADAKFAADAVLSKVRCQIDDLWDRMAAEMFGPPPDRPVEREGPRTLHGRSGARDGGAR